MSKTVLISTGESSGELYGALLTEKMKALWPDVRVLGIGGQRMKEAGVEVFSGFSSAIGIMEAISALKEIKATLRKAVEQLDLAKPDVVVLIDYPDFNFKLAREAKSRGIKVFYYVSPQLWAWRQGRMKTMQELVDAIAVILPFEEKLYSDAGVRAKFVGHPVYEEMSRFTSEKAEAKRLLGLEPDKPCIALLPGSRNNELSTLLPALRDTVALIRQEFPAYDIVLSIAPNIDESRYEEFLAPMRKAGVITTRQNAALLYTAAEAAVVASGTAAFQSIFRLTPIVVIYKLNPISYAILRVVTNLKHINLANIIMDRRVIPELMQGNVTPESIIRELRRLINDRGERESYLKEVTKVRDLFEGHSTADEAAALLGEVMGWQTEVAAA